MNCPPEIAAIVLDIIELAVWNIRGAASQGAIDECHAEADHIHNLPQLLRAWQPELLKFYWNVERPAFIARKPRSQAAFESLWEQLETLLPHTDLPRTERADALEMALTTR